MTATLREQALAYHRWPRPGKISVTPTKPLTNQQDLALAYSPGVAEACTAIADNPAEVDNLTSRANLVAVISNGTAVLGLGNIGPLAAKPVMEGKGCLFKKFADIDVFDIEVAENDPDRFIEVVAALEPTLGGINLEDIKAPECFYIERKLSERMRIPVFHDDQHGTAIIASAALLNATRIVGKSLDSVRLVCSGAGAAAIACLNLLCDLGLRRENILLCDSKGVVHTGRLGAVDETKAAYARDTEARTLADALHGADVFLGCSSGGVLKAGMLQTMADRPIILALANPTPEIFPEEAKAARPDCIIATGRSDYPNQVNNVLCFPFIFRGALDVGATAITPAMKMACVRAIADLATEPLPTDIASRFGGALPQFGPDYIIPKPFDPRLLERLAPAVAQAAMNDGVARRPIADLDAYAESLRARTFHSGMLMRPVFAAARGQRKRVVYSDGADARVLQALRTVCDERMALPIVIGERAAIAAQIDALGLRLEIGRDFEVVAPQADTALQAAEMVADGTADAMLCGLAGRYADHLAAVRQQIGAKRDDGLLAAMNGLILPQRTLFIADTQIHASPDAAQLAAIAELAVAEVRAFGLEPRVAFVSDDGLEAPESPVTQKMLAAAELFRAQVPGVEAEGGLGVALALSASLRERLTPDSRLTGDATLLVMSNKDLAHMASSLLMVTGGEGVTVGPILLGARCPVHILTASATVRRIVNLTALAVADAGRMH